MEDLNRAASTIAGLLQGFTESGGLKLRYRITARGAKANDFGASEESPSGLPPRSLYVEFSGPDAPMLTARNGEVLNALEHIAAKVLRLEPEEHDRISFDANHFKSNRDRELRESAAAAIERVHATGRPHAFPPMSSRERRMVHMILSESGLPTASSGEGFGRFVVLYPEGADTSAPVAVREPTVQRDASHLRTAFRHR